MAQNSNNYYLDIMQNKINKLNLKKYEYESQIIEKNKNLEHYVALEQKLKFTKDLLNEEYNSLLRLLEKQGIFFEISVSEYKAMQWENLFMVKTAKGYEIQTKTGSILMMVDENLSKIIQDIDKKDSHSLIVVRVMHKAVLALLRFS